MVCTYMSMPDIDLHMRDALLLCIGYVIYTQMNEVIESQIDICMDIMVFCLFSAYT